MDPDVLKKAPLFARLEDEAARALASAMGTLRLNKGEVLFREGDLEDRLYIVVSGKIKLGRSGSAGRENLLAVLGPGQMFGELSAFDPGPRSSTATAVTASEVRTLEHEELMSWLTGRPEVAQGLLGQMAARLRRANDGVADLVFSDVPGRVATEIIADGTSADSALGVNVGGNDTSAASTGVALQEVTPGGAADKAGLRTGDVVTKLNDFETTSPDGLIAAVRFYAPGTAVTVTYTRDNGDPQTTTVTLGSR